SRRSLAGEIDRLDSILDGLADNLDQAIGDAVRQALAQQLAPAVQHQLQQALANRPDNRPAAGPTGNNAAGPGQPGGLVRAAGRIEGWAAAGLAALGLARTWVQERSAAARQGWLQAGEQLRQAWEALKLVLPLLWLLRWHALAAAGAGAGL